MGQGTSCQYSRFRNKVYLEEDQHLSTLGPINSEELLLLLDFFSRSGGELPLLLWD
jgi:hypothetical protein